MRGVARRDESMLLRREPRGLRLRELDEDLAFGAGGKAVGPLAVVGRCPYGGPTDQGIERPLVLGSLLEPPLVARPLRHQGLVRDLGSLCAVLAGHQDQAVTFFARQLLEQAPLGVTELAP